MNVNPYDSPKSDATQPPTHWVSRLPSSVSFTCERCGWKPWLQQLCRRLGKCKRCHGETWSLTASYTDYEVSIGWWALFTRWAWYARKKFSNEITVANVNADEATDLVENRRLLKRRVSEFLSVRERERLLERGAITCKACDALFVPAAGKPWNEQGYCSKACAAEEGLVVFDQRISTAENESVDRGRLTLHIVCPTGHDFDVLASFSGCVRSCPICGAKCQVP